jgi:hypothetical protein
LPLGKTPGIDDLPNEFYKKYEKLLIDDLLEVYMEAFNNNKLPTSMRRAIICSIYKGGDKQLLNNWRPISLLTKILIKILLNRLNVVIEPLIAIEQTYAVKGRSIISNTSIIRDMILHANSSQTPLAVISLDQEKAFDSISHDFLFAILKSINLGPNFMNWIQLLYEDADAIVRVRNSYTRPIRILRGVRQGCALSATLFSLCTSAFIYQIKDIFVSNHSEPNENPLFQTYITAYADDITIFVRDDTDFNAINKCCNEYRQVSTINVNMIESNGLWCGSWINRTETPLGLKWTNTNIKILGIIFTNSIHIYKDQQDIIEKILTSILTRWYSRAQCFSYRGRAIIANILATSSIWYYIRHCLPPTTFLDKLQKMIVNFVWRTKHWTKPDILSLPVSEGGQGLVSIPTRTYSLALRHIQLLCQNNSDDKAVINGNFILSTQTGIEDFSLLISKNYSNYHIYPFYKRLLQYWGEFSEYLEIDWNAIGKSTFLGLPFLNNLFINDLNIQSPSFWTKITATCFNQIIGVNNYQ